MNIVIHAQPTISWHKRYATALLKGLRTHDITAKITDSHTRLPGTDVAILLGPNAWKLIESNPKPYLMVNRKFLGFHERDAHDIVAIGWDGLNGRATFCVDNVSDNRLFEFIDEKDIQEWHQPSAIRKYYLLCEQSDAGRSTHYHDCAPWYQNVTKQCEKPLLIRHKSNPEYGHINVFRDAFKKDMNTTKCGIILNSTVGIDINLAGVPVISCDEGSPTWAIDSHTINKINYSTARLNFFKYLAHCQFRISEIENGMFWEQLKIKRGAKLCDW